MIHCWAWSTMQYVTFISLSHCFGSRSLKNFFFCRYRPTRHLHNVEKLISCCHVFQVVGFDKYCKLIRFVPHCKYLSFWHLLIYDRYELMSECWNQDLCSRPSFSELIDRLEVLMTRNVPYCDVDKHDESRPYYNVPANADEHSGLGIRKWQKGLQDNAQWTRTFNFKKPYLTF